MIKFIKNNKRKTVVFIIMLICLLFYIFVPMFFKYENILYLNNIYLVSQIISSVFVIAGVIIAVWQYYLVSRSEIIKLEKEGIQKAIDLAGYYKDNILNNFSAIEYIYDEVGITQILNNIVKKDMVNFDEQELTQVLTKNNLDKLNDIQNSDNFVNVVLDANSIYKLKLNKAVFSTVDVNGKVIINDDLVKRFATNLIYDTLNSLEYFALHFTHLTANPDVVYQSLHKTYIRIVQTLYFTISKKNKPSSPRLYTNVINLYNTWNEKSMKQLEDIANKHRENTIGGDKIVESLH